MRTTLALLALLAGCEQVELGGTYAYLDELVDPTGAVAGTDAVFMPLPRAGGVARLAPGAEEATVLDLGARRVERLQATPTGDVLARTVATLCDDETVTGTRIDDCPYDELRRVGFVQRLGREKATDTWQVGPWYGDFTFSADGRWAVAPIDPDVGTTGGGIVNLTSLLALDLGSGRRFEIPVGFAADRILFVEDEAGARSAVVLSRSAVAVVDLTADLPGVRITYPLTLDAGSPLSPRDVVLTPDGGHALVTVAGSTDLYVLDLQDPSINLVSLAGTPADLVVDPANDQTLLVYANRSLVEVLDHQLFDLREVTLARPANHIDLGPDYALLSQLGAGLDLVRLDLASLRTDTIRLNYPPDEVQLAPDGAFAVTLVRSGSQGDNLELVDLVLRDGRVRTTSTAFRLDGAPVGLAMTEIPDGMSLLVLQQGVDTLFELSWPLLGLATADLPGGPAALGRVGDGFWIAHDDPLGLVSFYTPGEDVVSLAGFGRTGLFDVDQLFVEEE
ncbi:MAG: hypothetical protein H6732_19865 [Alphaproteobacteria bacterium]|nr:hypothetical protein [Alphaproteobacteria bacterium]